ncbi:hypothetical protein ABW21_db0205062 [Orbilia brochopaga]|nr:hypothetical protein ABW21_db0205062 [Drechslerella brochopaga]
MLSWLGGMARSMEIVSVSILVRIRQVAQYRAGHPSGKSEGARSTECVCYSLVDFLRRRDGVCHDACEWEAARTQPAKSNNVFVDGGGIRMRGIGKRNERSHIFTILSRQLG